MRGALLLAAFALLLAAPLSASVAQAIGSTKSFLDFTLVHNLRIELTANALQYGAAALGVTVLAQVLPSLGAYAAHDHQLQAGAGAHGAARPGGGAPGWMCCC